VVLVDCDNESTLKFDHAETLEDNENVKVALTLSNFPGYALVAKTASHYDNNGYNTVDLMIGPSSKAMEVKRQGKFLVRDCFGDVFDIHGWSYTEDNVVYVLDGGSTERTFDAGGGRNWKINSNGSISPDEDSDLCLGFRPPMPVLVGKGSSRAL
jgi:hypothetical protein